MKLLAAALLASLDSEPVRIAVSLAEDAPVASSTRQVLEAELHALFRPLRVELDWKTGATAPIQLTIARRPDAPVVSGCSRGLHDHRLAIARLGSDSGWGSVVVWVDQVVQGASGNWDRQAPALSENALGRALARTLAHELGHILLHERGHTGPGIMERSLGPRDLTGARRGFSREQKKRLTALLR